MTATRPASSTTPDDVMETSVVVSSRKAATAVFPFPAPSAVPPGETRYVDDYLIVLGKVPCERVQGVVKRVFEVFNIHSCGLKFTHEMPIENEIQYLDLWLSFAKEHICFKYNPQSKKGLLTFDSAHSKLIKRGIVLSACAAALDKSCPHLMFENFENHVARLGAAGYPAQF
ncbi:hypothetical protein MRX96_011088 [Rhipicephalus microplus]